MTTLTYLVQSALWSLGGLVVGFFMGRSTRAVEAIAVAVQDDEGDAMTTDEPAKVKRRHRITGNGVIVIVLIALGIATAVQGYVQGEATARLTECQAAYANGFADALDARSRASAEAQLALDDLLATAADVSLTTPAGREAVQEALRAYEDKRAEARATQQEHPYPDPPRDVC